MSEQITRRDAIKRAIYIAPVILTLTAVPAFASNGSGSPGVQSESWLGKNHTDDRGDQDNQGHHGNQDSPGHQRKQGNQGHHGNHGNQ